MSEVPQKAPIYCCTVYSSKVSYYELLSLLVDTIILKLKEPMLSCARAMMNMQTRELLLILKASLGIAFKNN